jgi:nitroreductase
MQTLKKIASTNHQPAYKTVRGLSVLKVLHVLSLFLVSSMLVIGEELKPISLPRPELSGGKTFMEAILLRRTIREFGPEKLSPQELGGVLWAGFGINRPSDGRRTAPSAMNSQEVDLYVALAEGLYVYEPKEHQLNPVLAGDFRGKTGQTFATNAAAVVIFVADFTRLAKAKPETRLFYSGIDTGAISQNIYLFCAANDLATVVYDLNREPLAWAMELKPSQEVILAQALGHPKQNAGSPDQK